MNHDPTVSAVERAFQLAKSGEFASIVDIRKRLNAEGYSVAVITGGVLLKQLRTLMKAVREAS